MTLRETQFWDVRGQDGRVNRNAGGFCCDVTGIQASA